MPELQGLIDELMEAITHALLLAGCGGIAALVLYLLVSRRI